MSNAFEATAGEIRPGVFRPDWSAVTTRAAQGALLARLASRESLADRWSTPLAELHDGLWRDMLRLFADLGRGPTVADLAARTGWPSDRLRAVLQDLQHRDLLGLDASGSTVLFAYPFTEHPTGTAVQLGDRVLNALCAVDALGVGAMFGQDVAIRSECRACDTDIRLETASRGRALGSVSEAGAVVWYDRGFEGCAATSCCPNTAFFCSDRHLHAWRERAGSHVGGQRLSLTEALEVGRALFGPVLAERPTTMQPGEAHDQGL